MKPLSGLMLGFWLEEINCFRLKTQPPQYKIARLWPRAV